MDASTKEEMYHSAVYSTAGSTMMDFEPINQIHQHLCAFHTYATDRTRHVEAHHFCTHLNHDLHQCIIYDSDKPGAKLIGIEYIVSEKVFLTLSEDEQKFWHSHKYEVESGMLKLSVKDIVPEKVSDYAEQPAMVVLHKSYGKAIHTWQIDISPTLPLGPPALMMSYTGDSQVEGNLTVEMALHSEETKKKRAIRQGYLPPYEKAVNADQWEKTGQSVDLEPVTKPVKRFP
ncbi:DUF1264-domain-containing protein [Hysterangium stoloniferum]|nr:DUF1264-domain-containing protein [Hysterangium stoloniferum]